MPPSQGYFGGNVSNSPLRKGRACAAALALALLTSLAVASSASAATITQQHTCSYPLVSEQRTLVTFGAAVPSKANAGEPVGSVPAIAEVTLNAETLEGLNTVRAASLSGSLSVGVTFAGPGEAPRSLEVEFPIPSTTVPRYRGNPGETFALSGLTGRLAVPTFKHGGSASVTVDEVSFNLAAKDRDGVPVELASQSWDPDSDNDPATFDLPCELDAGQPTLLATVDVGEISTPNGPPTTPTGVQVLEKTPTSARLAWNPSTDDVGVVGYDILFTDDRLAATSIGPSVMLAGLRPETTYTLRVVAKDAAGNSSNPSAPVTFTTHYEVWPRYTAKLNGTARLSTLTKGSVPVNGSVDLLQIGFETQGNLALAPTRGRLLALGFIPVTADVAFVQAAPASLRWAGGTASLSALTKIRLPQIYLFGSVSIAGAGSCQTKRASEITLHSAPVDRLVDIDRFTGTFAISDLTGCGAFNGLISPLAAGGGNTLDLRVSDAQYQ